MSEEFVCPICGNKDQKYIGIRNGQKYCRLCLSFQGNAAKNIYTNPKDASFHLNYSLSSEQDDLSEQLYRNFCNGKNSFIHAVCGSGKTEIVLKSISYCISAGLKVGFAVPRRDVARELYERFKSILIKNRITLVCGGHTNLLYGDLVVLTTHQLYRYEQYFDLLILDEVDAFPYKGSYVLQSFFERSIKGHYICMSATPDQETISRFKKNGGEVLSLNKRFHRYPLPVPQIILRPKALLFPTLVMLLRKIRKMGKPVFVFAPTIMICEETALMLKPLFGEQVSFVHSKCKDREKRIEDFRKGKTTILVTTAVLERGVTIKDLQVIVFHANHSIYNQYNLVQISGRVGRKADAPEGEVFYVANEKNYSMDKSIEDIERSNKDLPNLLR